jgi:hypothetical protein
MSDPITLLAAQADPWFVNPGLVGALLGSAVGVLGGGVYGPLVGTLAPQGKGRRLVFAYHWALVLAGCGLLVAGLTALAAGQPIHVWAVLGGPGLLLAAILLPLTPVLRARYRQADQRRLEAEEFRRG